jgi:hypothetical protein
MDEEYPQSGPWNLGGWGWPAWSVPKPAAPTGYLTGQGEDGAPLQTVFGPAGPGAGETPRRAVPPERAARFSPRIAGPMRRRSTSQSRDPGSETVPAPNGGASLFVYITKK